MRQDHSRTATRCRSPLRQRPEPPRIPARRGRCAGPSRFRIVAACRLAPPPAKDAAKLAATPTGAPLRMAFVYVPNGVHQGYWWPKKEGKDFELNKTLQPLEKVKQHAPDPGRAGPDQCRLPALTGPAIMPGPAARF